MPLPAVPATEAKSEPKNSPYCKLRTQREVSRTAFEVSRSDSGTDAACRAIKEPKPKPERKAAESAESSAPLAAAIAKSSARLHNTPRVDLVAAPDQNPEARRWASTYAETCTCARGDPELEE